MDVSVSRKTKLSYGESKGLLAGCPRGPGLGRTRRRRLAPFYMAQDGAKSAFGFMEPSTEARTRTETWVCKNLHGRGGTHVRLTSRAVFVPFHSACSPAADALHASTFYGLCCEVAGRSKQAQSCAVRGRAISQAERRTPPRHRRRRAPRRCEPPSVGQTRTAPHQRRSVQQDVVRRAVWSSSRGARLADGRRRGAVRCALLPSRWATGAG